MEFISEPIEPEAGSFGPEMMARGLASLPGAFAWRGRRYRIVQCLEHVKQSAPEATGEVYLRRQEFLVLLDSGQRARVYVTRQAGRRASARASRQRWFIYSIEQSDGRLGSDA